MSLDDEELAALEKRIKEWPYTDFAGLLEFVKNKWAYADCGYWSEEEPIDGERRLLISTAGWSDNEFLMGALQENQMFWALNWYSSRRGGHYEFRMRNIAPRSSQGGQEGET